MGVRTASLYIGSLIQKLRLTHSGLWVAQAKVLSYFPQAFVACPECRSCWRTVQKQCRTLLAHDYYHRDVVASPSTSLFRIRCLSRTSAEPDSVQTAHAEYSSSAQKIQLGMIWDRSQQED